MNRGPRVLVAFLVLAGIATLFWSASFRSVAKEELPLQLSDEAFWKLTTDFSEPGGFFRSDNFVSNEDGFQIVIPELKKTLDKAGVRHAIETLKGTHHGYCFAERKDYDAIAAEDTWTKLFALWDRNLK